MDELNQNKEQNKEEIIEILPNEDTEFNLQNDGSMDSLDLSVLPEETVSDEAKLTRFEQENYNDVFGRQPLEIDSYKREVLRLQTELEADRYNILHKYAIYLGLVVGIASILNIFYIIAFVDSSFSAYLFLILDISITLAVSGYGLYLLWNYEGRSRKFLSIGLGLFALNCYIVGSYNFDLRVLHFWVTFVFVAFYAFLLWRLYFSDKIKKYFDLTFFEE